MSSDIVVVGSLAYDTISTPSGSADRALGGSANYFSVAASMYTKVRAVGVIGDDYAESDLAKLTSRGVDTLGIEKLEGKTFHWEGKYEGDMNEAITLATELNVFAQFKPQLNQEYRTSKFVFLANIDPEIQLDLLSQVDNPTLVACDTMNFWIETKKDQLLEVLKKVDVLLINETESLMLTKEQNAVGACRKICELGPKAVVVKRGEYGFMFFSEGKYFVLPAFPISDVVDPTGAGDTFAAGFMGYLARNGKTPTDHDFRHACMHGTVMASFTVQDFGLGRLDTLNNQQVEGRLKDYMDVVTTPLS